ncbi:MAG: TlpA family protein disulfide reductase [Planctomycetaceae bacterium]|nr:TlpA family protein disulfide reductase [Planctomycetaceae bacterium]
MGNKARLVIEEVGIEHQTNQYAILKTSIANYAPRCGWSCQLQTHQIPHWIDITCGAFLMAFTPRSKPRSVREAAAHCLFVLLAAVAATSGPVTDSLSAAASNSPPTIALKSVSAVLTSSGITTTVVTMPVPDEKPAPSQKVEPDPYAVPDGDTPALKKHIARMAQMRVTGKSVDERLSNNIRRLRSVVEAAERILGQSPSESDEVFALENAYGALQAMGERASEEMQKKKSQLEARMDADPRTAVARIPAFARLENATGNMLRLGVDSRAAAIDQVAAYVERFGPDQAVMALAHKLGRSLSASGDSQSAVKLLEFMGRKLQDSDNPAVAMFSDRFFAAARMAGLPGNFMEVRGVLADGSDFDWEKYRGKTVLIDFWASWCGPCLAELPNMKACLEEYGQDGFTIVGVNLDRSRDAFDKCVKEKGISWENIMDEGDDSLAEFYGISAIPTAVLVDENGKVLSLNARGTTLPRLLEQHFASRREKSE